MKPAKILYFINGPIPSAEQYAEAAAMKAQVMFRNATAVPNEPHSLEICDGVAGEVPAIYADAFPSADEAISKKAAELKALADKVGDAPAPKKGGQQAPAKDNKPNAPASGQQAPAAPAGGGQTPPAWNPNPAQ